MRARHDATLPAPLSPRYLLVMLSSPPRRIGIVMMSAVGDAVHVLPLLTALKRHSAEVRVTWVLQPGAASLVRGHPAVDDIVEFDRALGWRAFPAVRRQLAQREFDVVLALQVYLKAGIVTSFTRAPVKLGFDRPRARDLNWLFTTDRIPAREGQHVQDQYFEFLDALHVPHEPVVWDLGPWPHERAWQRTFYDRFDRPVAPIVVGTQPLLDFHAKIRVQKFRWQDDSGASVRCKVFPNLEQEQRVKIREPIEWRAEAFLEINPVLLRIVEPMRFHVGRVGDNSVEQSGLGLEVVCQYQLRAAWC